MRLNKWITLFLGSVWMVGCQTAPSKSANGQGPSDNAQTAIKSIANTLEGKQVRAKYCPVCARHYSSKLIVCPKDGSELKEVEEAP